MKSSAANYQAGDRAPRQSPGRVCNAHSKSLAHHTAMVAIFVCWYNFCRSHETIKKTPAMAVGLTDKPWTIREMIEKAEEA